MKKAVVYMLVMAFVLSIVSVAFARTLSEEKAAVRSYLSVIDAKIIKYRKAGNTAKMKVLQADKKATLARWAKLQASMGVTPAAPPPPPVAPVPPPPPPVVVRPAPAPTGMFGMGLNTDVALGYIAGKSVMVGRADLLLDDPLALGSMFGLSARAINYRIGIGGASGNDINDKSMKAIPLFVDGILNLPADWMGGIESYVGGGLNYTVYGSGQKTGTSGIQVFAGVTGDLGLGGKSFVEVGYSAIRPDKRSGKGVGISFGQQIML